MRTRRFKLTRQRSRENAGSKTLFFTTDGGSRKHPAKIFHPNEVPDFEGETAWFEAEWVLKRGWRLVRRVNEHGQPLDVQGRPGEFAAAIPSAQLIRPADNCDARGPNVVG